MWRDITENKVVQLRMMLRPERCFCPVFFSLCFALLLPWWRTYSCFCCQVQQVNCWHSCTLCEWSLTGVSCGFVFKGRSLDTSTKCMLFTHHRESAETSLQSEDAWRERSSLSRIVLFPLFTTETTDTTWELRSGHPGFRGVDPESDGSQKPPGSWPPNTRRRFWST